MLEFPRSAPGPFRGDLHRSFLLKLKAFLIELGQDFCFVGSEYPVQVDAAKMFTQTDRVPLAPTQCRGDGRENCLQYMRIVSNA